MLMLNLSLVFMAFTFIVFAAYGMFAAYLRPHILSNPPVQRWMQSGFAAAFGVLAAQLALATK